MTLYHYCSNSSFAAIVSGRSIHLSLLSLSNDTMEGRLVTQSIMRLADRDKLDLLTKEKLKENLKFLEETFDGLGFCLSEEGDLLSQWRGYVDGGKGVSIGFSKKYLNNLSKKSNLSNSPGFHLSKVEYDPAKHDAAIEPTYTELKVPIDEGAFRLGQTPGLLNALRPKSEVEGEQKKYANAYRELLHKIFNLHPKLFELKASAFREEKEWRLVSILMESLAGDCQFRSTPDRLIPYRSYDLVSLDNSPILNEVVIGPKNLTPPSVIKLMLKSAGFGDVMVRRSDATFR